jgi:hypothetical protein
MITSTGIHQMMHWVVATILVCRSGRVTSCVYETINVTYQYEANRRERPVQTITSIQKNYKEIWDSHSHGYEQSYLLGYNAA